MQIFLGLLMSAVSIFIILLVLVQRGRGGGLAGALGGAGGQSAFGAKAGDTFTWITIGAAVCWILLCVAAIKLLDDDVVQVGGDFIGAGVGAPAGTDDNAASPNAASPDAAGDPATPAAGDSATPAAGSGEPAADSTPKE